MYICTKYHRSLATEELKQHYVIHHARKILLEKKKREIKTGESSFQHMQLPLIYKKCCLHLNKSLVDSI